MTAQAAILQLMPRKTSFRLSDPAYDLLSVAAEHLGVNKTAAVETAIRHLVASLKRDEGIHYYPFPDGPRGPDGAVSHPLRVVEKTTQAVAKRKRR